jgi:hypothetical protein
MNLLLSILLITVSGKAIITLCFVFLLVIILWAYLKKDEVYVELYHPDNFERDKSIVFSIKNNTNEELVLDLCHLDKNDSRYSFEASGSGYENIIEYIKTHSVFVHATRIKYEIGNTWDGIGIPNWFKNYIYLNEITPFSKGRTPILVACDDVSENQFQSNVIDTVGSYSFDYLNSLEVKLLPNDNIELSLFCSDYNKLIKKKPIKCALLLKNTSDCKQKVNLFDKDYFDSEKKQLDGIQIESIFGKEHYKTVINTFEAIPLVANNIKFIITNENRESVCKINNEEFPICYYLSAKQFQSNVVNCPLSNDTYINNMSIEIEPNTEIIISIK